MRGVKGCCKTVGDACSDCGGILTKETCIPRGGTRSGVHSYCRKCHRKKQGVYRNRRREANCLRNRKYRFKLRETVLAAYGSRCACCGESTVEFLAIDHIDGGGTKERKLHGNTPAGIHRKIIKEGFPESYRILCHNCNMARAFYGQCPHERMC